MIVLWLDATHSCMHVFVSATKLFASSEFKIYMRCKNSK